MFLVYLRLSSPCFLQQRLSGCHHSHSVYNFSMTASLPYNSGRHQTRIKSGTPCFPSLPIPSCLRRHRSHSLQCLFLNKGTVDLTKEGLSELCTIPCLILLLFLLATLLQEWNITNYYFPTVPVPSHKRKWPRIITLVPLVPSSKLLPLVKVMD